MATTKEVCKNFTSSHSGSAYLGRCMRLSGYGLVRYFLAWEAERRPFLVFMFKFNNNVEKSSLFGGRRRRRQFDRHENENDKRDK